ncbi:hypothetical protein GCM10020367_68900 [Streptomyces sannanensis]|uniref:Uncharacterized protein n=1 Tax=Streptomyces sannanensis TaxID=285536 RepID=A0ABP6SMQ2_9ACTN
MATADPAPMPAEDPFAEAVAEAARTTAAAVKLTLTIADAVRRAAQKHRQGREDELADGEEQLAPGWAAQSLRPVLDGGVLADLMSGADWPAMAGQLVLLQKAGVDLGAFLPQLGQVASTVYTAVEANAARISAEGTDRWADLLRKAMPEGLVRDAILASPAWPDMAAQMAALDHEGVDVTGFLTAAHGQGVGVDRAVAALLARQGGPQPAAPAAAAPAVPAARTAPGPDPAAAAPELVVAVSADARSMWGPLTEGLNVPNDLNLSDRLKAGLLDNTAWQQGPPSELAGRLVGAILRALTTPPGAPVPDGPRVSATAARSRSTTTPTAAAPGQGAPAEPPVPAHRQQAAPARRQGHGR